MCACVKASACRQARTLFTLRSDDIRNWRTRLRQLQEDQLSLVERAKKLEDAHSAELDIKDSEIVQADREIEFRQKYRAASSNFLNTVQILSEEGSSSRLDIIHAQLDLGRPKRNWS